MNPLEKVRLWMFDNRFRKRVQRLQHEQVIEHREILDDLRASRRGILHDLADEVLRLQAVTDSLEDSLDDMSKDSGE